MPNHPDAKRLTELALDQIQIHAIIVLDRDGMVRGWLGGAENVLGYKADEIIGKPLAQLFTEEDLDRRLHELEIEMAFASGEADDDRWQIRKDGAKIWVSGAMAPIRDATGEVVGYVKVLRNRTDNKIHLEALESRIKLLERTQELRVNSSATLAHEMRAPLSALASAAGVLERNPDKQAVTLATGIISNQVQFMTRLISHLLEGAAATAGKIELNKQPVVLQDILAEAVMACRPAVDRRSHELQVIVPVDPVPLLADPVRLHQVFVNLIDNAVKYTPDGGNIWIKATVDGEDAVVKVHDTGRGLAPEVVPHIFDLFVQASSPGEPREGLGIGLSLVKEFIHLHHGTVQALSDGVGKGSIFVVRMPVNEPRSTKPDPEVPKIMN